MLIVEAEAYPGQSRLRRVFLMISFSREVLIDIGCDKECGLVTRRGVSSLKIGFTALL